MASLWHTEKQGTLGRKGNYGECKGMDLKWEEGIEEMCSNEVKGGKKEGDNHCSFHFIFQ